MPKTQYHARHILVTTQEEAQKIIEQLKKGAKFEDLAKKNSTDSPRIRVAISAGSRPPAW